MIQTIVIIVAVLAFMGILVFLAKKNERLKGQIEELKDTNKKQVEITKVYEKKQKVANEIKDVGKDTADSTIGTGNSIVDSFNDRVSNKSKK